jgi:acyl carrier protein
VTQPEIFARLQEVFDGVFLEPVQVTAALTAKDVPEWDSLLHVSLVLAIESAFKVRFRVGEVEGTRNVGELAALIERRLAG